MADTAEDQDRDISDHDSEYSNGEAQASDSDDGSLGGNCGSRGKKKAVQRKPPQRVTSKKTNKSGSTGRNDNEIEYTLTEHVVALGGDFANLADRLHWYGQKCPIKLVPNPSTSPYCYNLGNISFPIITAPGSREENIFQQSTRRTLESIDSEHTEIFIGAETTQISLGGNPHIICLKISRPIECTYLNAKKFARTKEQLREDQISKNPAKKLKFRYEEQKEFYYLGYLPKFSFQWIKALKSKAFRLTFVEYKRQSFAAATLTVNVSMNDDFLGSHSELGTIPSLRFAGLPTLLAYLLHVEPYEQQVYVDQREKENIDWLFEQISKYRQAQEKLPIPSRSIQHSALVPTLREYQKEAVNWMVHRENGGKNEEKEFADTFLKDMYKPITLTKQNGETISGYLNRYVGAISTVLPRFEVRLQGMLCDEMGLGKTLEIITLTLLNPMPQPQLQIQKYLKFGNSQGNDDTNLTSVVPSKKLKIEKCEPRIQCFCYRTTKSQTEKIITCTKCNASQHVKCMNHDYHNLENYICHWCFPEEDILHVKATLIVTPIAIREQWLNELDNHVKRNQLKVLDYKGRGRRQLITPSELAQYDIVITTYDVLSKEILFTDFDNGCKVWNNRLRKRTTNLKCQSPFSYTHWWRVCIDEAQMVEGVETRMSQMAKNLKCEHRWCVTGTPMQKGIQDLYGLISFLGIRPIDETRWWNWLVSEPYYRKDTRMVLNLFGRIMLRRSKLEVANQLGVPPQTSVNHWLRFGQVEQYFYGKQFTCASAKIIEAIDSLICMQNVSVNTKLSKLDRYNFERLMKPFLEIRRACCHPQAVTADKAPLADFEMKIFTMNMFLDQMIDTNYKEANLNLAGLLKNLIKMAELHVKNKKPGDAWEQFKQIFELEKKYGEKLCPKAEQILKAVEVFPNAKCSTATNEEKAQMKDEAARLQGKYSGRYSGQVIESQELYEEKAKEVDAVKEKLDFSWFKILLAEQTKDISEILIPNIKLALNKHGYSQSELKKVSLASSLEQKIVEKLQQIGEARDEAKELMKPFVARTTEKSQLSKLIGCSNCYPTKHRPDQNKDPNGIRMCEMCQASKKVHHYEKCVLNVDQMENNDKWNKMTGGEQKRRLEKMEADFNKNDGDEVFADDTRTEVHIVTEVIWEFAKAVGLPKSTADHGIEFLKYYNLMTSEVASQLVILAKIHEEESGSCKDGFKKIKQWKDPNFGQKLRKYKKNCENFTRELNINMGSLFFLENMKKNSDDGACATKDGSCAVCFNDLGKEYCVLKCAHYYCSDCVRQLCEIRDRLSVQCPHCRAVTKFDDVGKVTSTSDVIEQPKSSMIIKQGPDGSPILEPKRVQGSYSTKVAGILEILLQLRAERPGEKVLLFSSWPQVMDLIEFAMMQNAINFVCVRSCRTVAFTSQLNAFKIDPEIQVMLLPFKDASAGLNIIEATHIILVEPLLNASTEAQAIGRVHRGGQTKPTFVHRFYVVDTIEQHLYELSKTNTSSSSFDDEKNEGGGLTLETIRKIVKPE